MTSTPLVLAGYFPRNAHNGINSSPFFSTRAEGAWAFRPMNPPQQIHSGFSRRPQQKSLSITRPKHGQPGQNNRHQREHRQHGGSMGLQAHERMPPFQAALAAGLSPLLDSQTLFLRTRVFSSIHAGFRTENGEKLIDPTPSNPCETVKVLSKDESTAPLRSSPSADSRRTHPSTTSRAAAFSSLRASPSIPP